MKAKPETIVAEITKNWREDDRDGNDLIATRFEKVINVNATRGYRLDSWRFFQLSYPGQAGEPLITETIIAVFKLGINE